MRLSSNTRPLIFGLILAIGIPLTSPYLAFGAAHSFGGSRRFGGGSTMHRQHSFSRPFHGFGLFGVDGVDEQPVIIFSNFSLQQLPNPENRSQTEFTFSHAGWRADMECRSCSQDTGPIRSKRRSVDGWEPAGTSCQQPA